MYNNGSIKLLMTGGSGLLGSEIQNQARKQEIQIKAPSSANINIRAKDDLVRWIQHDMEPFKHNILIHAAAKIGLPQCENNKRGAYETNVVGTKNVVDVCQKFGVSVVYISTDYVFNGEQGNYKEDDYLNPLSHYAFTKTLGEAMVRGAGERVIRTSFCPLKWPYEAAFNDKFTSMIPVDIAACNILSLCSKLHKWDDVVHLGQPRTTFYEIAKGLGNPVARLSINEVDAKIPRDTSFNLDKLNSIG